MKINVPDALVQMEKAMKRDKIETNDKQLACARIKSQEGQDYLKAMSAAANFAWVNRSSMTFLCRQVKKIWLNLTFRNADNRNKDGVTFFFLRHLQNNLK